ncbi:MAG: hypothetical protein Kow0065_13080 [Methylomicrobium sp.]
MKALLLVLVVTTTASAETQTPNATRQQELRNLLKHDCGACHGMTLKGGLGSSLLPQDLANKPDALLIETILNGRNGTAMPPWRQFITTEEATWLVQLLKNPQSP